MGKHVKEDGKTIPIWLVYSGDQIKKGWTGKVPQFLSVLTGRMSLVGSDLNLNGTISPKDMKPGLTGLVQIQNNKNLSDEEKGRFDTYYLKNYSILLDAEILFKSVFHL